MQNIKLQQNGTYKIRSLLLIGPNMVCVQSLRLTYLFAHSLNHFHSIPGKYEFASADPNGLFTGSLAGTPSSWRTMQYTGGLNEIDSILLGALLFLYTHHITH